VRSYLAREDNGVAALLKDASVPAGVPHDVEAGTLMLAKWAEQAAASALGEWECLSDGSFFGKQRDRKSGGIDRDQYALCLVPRDLHTYLGQVRVLAIDGTCNTDREGENKMMWIIGVTHHPVRVSVMLVLVHDEGTEWSATKAWSALRHYVAERKVCGKTSATAEQWFPEYILTDNLATWYGTASATWSDQKITWLLCLWQRASPHGLRAGSSRTFPFSPTAPPRTSSSGPGTR
jgi:hypothetical protein